MKIAVVSDIHAGIGADDSGLRKVTERAVNAAAKFLQRENPDVLIFNGDTTDHLANALAADTSAEIAQAVLAPLRRLIQQRRGVMRTILLAGNTDWVLADKDSHNRDIFFQVSGFSENDVHIPDGGLLHIEQADGVVVACTHGHACKPAQCGHVGTMDEETYASLLEQIRHPSPEFLDAISATSGFHRREYLAAVAIGSVARRLPASLRKWIVESLGTRYTREYEQHFSRILSPIQNQTKMSVLGVMGHTHVAGIRAYGNSLILNTGTTGAKPNPIQRVSDARAHLAIIDTCTGKFSLIQTFNPTRSTAVAVPVEEGTFPSVPS